MSVGEEQTQSERVFGTDEEVVSYSLNEFKKERAVFVQEVIDVEGGFGFGTRHLFQDRNEMRRWLWDLPGTKKYVAVAMSDSAQVLTLRGKKIVISYANIMSKPEIVFYKSFSKLPKYKINESKLKESVHGLVSALNGE